MTLVRFGQYYFVVLCFNLVLSAIIFIIRWAMLAHAN